MGVPKLKIYDNSTFHLPYHMKLLKLNEMIKGATHNIE